MQFIYSHLLVVCLILVPKLGLGLSLQVKIDGIDKKLEQSIRADLHLQQAISEAKVTPARIRNLYDLSEQQITETLQAKGYYNAHIKSDLSAQQDNWLASFTINPGKPATIATVHISAIGAGKDDARVQKFLTAPALKIGNIATQEDYEQTKEKLLAEFNSKGYLQATFAENQMAVDKEKNSVDIKVVINTGVLYVFGKINFIDSIYPDALLVRYLPFHTGEAYDLDKLMQFQSNLEQSDLFSKIRFDPITNFDDPKDLLVPINVRLTPKPRNRYTGSIGYGTDTGVRGSLGWLHRRVNTPGHRVLAYISTSKILRTAKLNYIIPGKQAATDNYIVGTSVQEEYVKDLYSRKGEVYATNVIKRGKLESLYGLNFFTETFHLTAKTKKQNKKYLLPNAKWIWINSNEKDEFDYGTRFDFRIRGGLKNALSSTNVLQADGGMKQIWPLVTRTRLVVRSNVGSVFSKKFASVPPSLRFFAGGDESIRGFAYNSIGPREIKGDPNSDNLGGKYLFTASGEVEHKLYDQLSGVLFLDAGNASMNFGGPLAMGSGFGVRYRTPIGNFRVDLAKPLNTVRNKHWRLHITFGTDF